MFRKRVGWIVLILIAATLTAGWAYRHHQRYKHFAVHEAGMVYRSAWLEPDVMSEVIEKHQIRTVINLCQPGEMGFPRSLRPALSFIRLQDTLRVNCPLEALQKTCPCLGSVFLGIALTSKRQPTNPGTDRSLARGHMGLAPRLPFPNPSPQRALGGIQKLGSGL